MKSRFLVYFLFSLFSVAAMAQSKSLRDSFKDRMGVTTICPDCPLSMVAPQHSNVIIQLAPEAHLAFFLLSAPTDLGIGLEYKKALAPKFGFYLIIASSKAKDVDFISLLQSHPDIISAQYDSPVQFRDSIPNDPKWPDQWSLDRIGLPAVWDYGTGGKTADGHEIVVAILDSGFDITHDDFQGNIWVNEKEANGILGEDDDNNGFIDDFNGWNFINNTNIHSVTGHGTSVAGIIGGKGNNGLGITGINWDVKIMFLTVDLISEVIGAFNYVIDQRELYNSTNGTDGAFVVVTNGSFGQDRKFCEDQPAWGAMYDLLGQVGVLNVAATANENWDVDELGDMPTTCTSDFLVAVTGTDVKDERSQNAAFGAASIDLGAPGANTVTLSLSQNYNTSFGGTSAACPHVAGTVALLYSMPCPDLYERALADPPSVALLMRNAILQNTFPIASLRGKTVTGGRLDAYESMKHIHSWCIGNDEDRSAEQVKEIYLGQRGLVRLSPNPATETLTVDFAAADFDTPVSFRVFNALGQEMQIPQTGKATPFEKQQITIDIKDWSKGFYVVNIADRTFKLSLPFIKM